MYIVPVISSQSSLARRHRLPESASLFLDLTRFAAALIVFVGHVSFSYFHSGLPDIHVIGEYAVPVFFVLSGFVIRFITRSRQQTLRTFLIDRASRLYSVVLPAMALTLFVAVICVRLDPTYYNANWGEVSRQPLTRILLNVTFLSQSWGHNTIPLINAPFWSLSYESLYYVAYGLAFYLRGWKRIVSLALWFVIAGPQVLLLLPVWWLGCLVYDLYHALSHTRPGRVLAYASLGAIGSATTLFLAGVHAPLMAPFRAVVLFTSLTNPLELLHIHPFRATMMAIGTGILAAVLMLGLLLITDLIAMTRQPAWAKPSATSPTEPSPST